jgi:hypothetical protein
MPGRKGHGFLQPWLTPLSLQPVGKHGFFEGRGSRRRLEPAQLAQLLELR